MGAFINPDWLTPATLEPNVTPAIVGASRPEQVSDNATASGAHVDPSLFTDAERLLPSH
jgi:aryl-alcohol dehydrogenase-like predicted oxidoreductase